MSTIINIANELQALQGRITADKASLQEARAMMEAEYAENETAEINIVDEIIAMFNRLHGERLKRARDRHARLMAFIDGQIAAKDEAIEGEAPNVAMAAE